MAPPFGANTWVWVSPLTDDRLAELAPRLAGWGFDVVEMPIEDVGDWAPGPSADLLAGLGLGATVCAVMPPGRELVATTPAVVSHTQAYLRACVDAAATVGSGVVAGPLYASVGRTWRMTPDERRAVTAELHEALAPVADYAGTRGVRLAVEPLNRYETSVCNTVDEVRSDLTEKLDTYLNRNLSRSQILMSYLYWIPESMFLALPAAVFTTTDAGRPGTCHTSARASAERNAGGPSASKWGRRRFRCSSTRSGAIRPSLRDSACSAQKPARTESLPLPCRLSWHRPTSHGVPCRSGSVFHDIKSPPRNRFRNTFCRASSCAKNARAHPAPYSAMAPPHELPAPAVQP